MALLGIDSDFISRVRTQSVSKLLLLILADREFVEDMRQAVSLDDYVQYLRDKSKKTIVENAFFLLPDKDQKTIWTTVRGKDDAAK